MKEISILSSIAEGGWRCRCEESRTRAWIAGCNVATTPDRRRRAISAISAAQARVVVKLRPSQIRHVTDHEVAQGSTCAPVLRGAKIWTLALCVPHSVTMRLAFPQLFSDQALRCAYQRRKNRCSRASLLSCGSTTAAWTTWKATTSNSWPGRVPLIRGSPHTRFSNTNLRFQEVQVQMDSENSETHTRSTSSPITATPATPSRGVTSRAPQVRRATAPRCASCIAQRIQVSLGRSKTASRIAGAPTTRAP